MRTITSLINNTDIEVAARSLAKLEVRKPPGTVLAAVASYVNDVSAAGNAIPDVFRNEVIEFTCNQKGDDYMIDDGEDFEMADVVKACPIIKLNKL